MNNFIVISSLIVCCLIGSIVKLMVQNNNFYDQTFENTSILPYIHLLRSSLSTTSSTELYVQSMYPMLQSSKLLLNATSNMTSTMTGIAWLVNNNAPGLLISPLSHFLCLLHCLQPTSNLRILTTTAATDPLEIWEQKYLLFPPLCQPLRPWYKKKCRFNNKNYRINNMPCRNNCCTLNSNTNPYNGLKHN